MENGPKMEPIRDYAGMLLAPFSRPSSDIDFGMRFGRPWAPFWHLLGSIWLPLGTLRLPFGTLWAPFW